MEIIAILIRNHSTSSVGVFYKDTSPYGVLDMAGNTMEWCHSLLLKYPYNSKDGRENVNAEGNRVVRGATWFSGSYSVRCAFRRYFPITPDSCMEALSFRVVIAPKLD